MSTITFEVTIDEEKSPLLRSFLVSNNIQFLERVSNSPDRIAPCSSQEIFIKQEDDVIDLHGHYQSCELDDSNSQCNTEHDDNETVIVRNSELDNASNTNANNEAEYQDIVLSTGVHKFQTRSIANVSPRDIAIAIDSWLKVTGTSQRLFAANIINRKQSTLSEILKRAPDYWPDGRGRWVYERMYQFLVNQEEQENLYTHRKDLAQAIKRENPASETSDLCDDNKKIRISDENYVPSFAAVSTNESDNKYYNDLDTDMSCDFITPKQLADNLLEWLKINRVSQSVFARKILDRQQSTLSGLITYATDDWPKGNGKIPYLKMLEFLNNKDKQEEFFAENGMKGNRDVEHRPIILSSNSIGTGTRVKQIRRSMFGDSQKAALDRVFISCKGRADVVTIQSIADTLGLEQHQVRVWFQNHRRLERTGAYRPGQYQQKGVDPS